MFKSYSSLDELAERRDRPRNNRLAASITRTLKRLDSEPEATDAIEAEESTPEPEPDIAEEEAAGAEELPPPRAPVRDGTWRKPHAIGSSPPPASPGISRDDAASVLRAWTAMEVLSPASIYRRPSDIADGSENRIAELDAKGTLPWERGEPARPNRRLFYQLVLGAVRMEEATSALLAAFKDYNENSGPTPGYAPICIVTLDNKGVPIGADSVSVSSFAWGLPFALERNLKALSDWPKHEERLREAVTAWITRTDEEEGDVLPLTRQIVANAFQKLIAELRLPSELVVEPHFAIRVYHWFRAEEPPEPPPMGSFFLNDLAWALATVERGAVPKLLAKYLGLTTATARKDVRRNDILADEMLAPNATPLGAWPSKGGHPLVLLQQAAVNASERLDLLAVNGPPGTGKTTLLRDLIAAKVVERAERLIEFASPEDAFSKTSHTQRINQTPCRHHAVDSKLKGFEIIVASSNNKAVENVSEALPKRGAAEFAASFEYFSAISDNVARGLDTEEKKHGLRRADPAKTTWGLAAAVLGNSSNRYTFSQCAWKDFDFGLRSYLLELSGLPQRIEVKDPDTGRIVERRAPRLVELVNAAPARPSWAKARQAFKATRAELQQRLSQLAAGRAAVGASEARAGQLDAARAALAVAEQEWVNANLGASRIEEAHHNARATLDRARVEVGQAAAAAPGMFARFFNGAEMQSWRERTEAADIGAMRAEAAMKAATAVFAEKQSQMKLAAARKEDAKTFADGRARDLTASTTALEAAHAIAGDRFADAAFFDRPPEDLQRDTAWFDPETQRLRRLMFEQAMEVHRAFIESAAGPIRNNLDLLFRTFFGKSAWTASVRERMSDLWSTFFLVVPAISTTYASVERMLGYLPEESIGLLLLDESGQAAPQSAVGALMRARKVVVVGDPMQLPPVVPLPTALCDLIANDCGVDSERYIAASRAIPLVASVQTLADAACQVGTHLETLDAWIGLPLLVHRRCAEPMFSLSNRISYEGIMVNGRGKRPSEIRNILGESRWIDVRPGRTIDKWSEAEGQALLRELERLVAAETETSPDIYIISPFRIVAQQLRQLLVKQDFLRRWASDPRRWVSERVGTVYTVQGREADTVFLVLGAAEPHQKGARNWAGNPPNQLNVAITRAQENLYVIGNRFEWASAGAFAELERALP
ncbi:MAG: ATP-binding protein [Hyphomonadaceae bacterium]|nr:ATP-binding protein [Hyphomonadaceae bacterium]